MIQTRQKSRFSLYIGCIMFLCLLCICGNEAGVPQHLCNKISTLEIRFRNYFHHYLSMDHNKTTRETTSIYEEGLLYKRAYKAVNKCCADSNIKVSCKWLTRSNLTILLHCMIYTCRILCNSNGCCSNAYLRSLQLRIVLLHITRLERPMLIRFY